VIHPWYLRLLGTLLETPWTLLRAGDPAELVDKLRRFDVPGGLAEARDDYRRRAQDKIPILEAFSVSLIKPEDLLLELVPVWAPDALLPEGVDRERMRSAYISLLDAPDPRGGVDALFACFRR